MLWHVTVLLGLFSRTAVPVISIMYSIWTLYEIIVNYFLKTQPITMGIHHLDFNLDICIYCNNV